MIYSNMVTKMIDSINMIAKDTKDADGSNPFMIFDVHKIIIAPTPYMGQNGPSKKPRFISFPSKVLAYVTSNIQPRNEYKKKNNIK